MEAKKIEVVKNWPKPKSIQDIKVFLGFANFYWQFIQVFSKIVAPLSSMLKTTVLPDKPNFNRNNSSKLASRRNDSNNKVNRFDGNNVEHTKKI